MSEIYLRFVSGGGYDSKIIQWHTCAKWSHVELYNPIAEETFGAMLSGGVKFRKLNDPQYKNAVDTKIFPINLSDIEYRLFSDFLDAQDGKPYDWRAIVSFGFGGMTFHPRNWREDDSWFCSELICRALETAGVLKLPDDIPASFVTPRDVWAFTAGLKS